MLWFQILFLGSLPIGNFLYLPYFFGSSFYLLCGNDWKLRRGRWTAQQISSHSKLSTLLCCRSDHLDVVFNMCIPASNPCVRTDLSYFIYVNASYPSVCSTRETLPRRCSHLHSANHFNQKSCQAHQPHPRCDATATFQTDVSPRVTSRKHRNNEPDNLGKATYTRCLPPHPLLSLVPITVPFCQSYKAHCTWLVSSLPAIAKSASPEYTETYFFRDCQNKSKHNIMALPLDIPINGSKIPHPPHPYYPLEVEITGYLANEWSVPALLGAFASGCAVIFGMTYLIIKRVQPRMPAHEVLTVMWFVLSKKSQPPLNLFAYQKSLFFGG